MSDNMLTLITFIAFTAAVAFFTWLLTRKDNSNTSDGFFLGGRSLTFPVIAASLLLTNLSTEQMVGLNGDAFSFGLNVMAWEAIAVFALVAMALFFLPRFLKSGITTVPEYLEMRYDRTTASIANGIFMLAYLLILIPIILYTGAQGFISILDLKAMTGIQSEIKLLYLICVIIGITGTIYALFGGLKTVAVSDLFNGIGLLVGGLMIVYFALSRIGEGEGILVGISKIRASAPERFNSIGTEGNGVEFISLFTGVLFINLFYWCTNQQIIQRTLGAKDLAEGQKGVCLTALLKLIGPLYLVLPGMAAYYFYKNGHPEIVRIINGGDQIADSPAVYGALVRTVMPKMLTGFFAGVLGGAILSSFNSALNSTCTLFSIGFYKPFIRPSATDAEMVKVSRNFGFIIAILSVAFAPMLNTVPSIFTYLQKMNGLYFIPLFAVIAGGMMNRRIPAKAARFVLIGGPILIAVFYFVPGFSTVVNYVGTNNFLGIAFMYLFITLLIWSEAAPMEKEYVQEDAKILDLTPWKHVKAACIGLILLVVAIYAAFADFSGLRKRIKQRQDTTIEQHNSTSDDPSAFGTAR